MNGLRTSLLHDITIGQSYCVRDESGLIRGESWCQLIPRIPKNDDEYYHCATRNDPDPETVELRILPRPQTNTIHHDKFTCTDPESFVRGGGGVQLRRFFLFCFLFDKEREDQKNRQMAFRWRADDGPTLNAG